MRIYYPDQPHNVPIKKDKEGNTYIIEHEWVYKDEEMSLLVKEGFKYDGASVPRLAWTLSGLRPDGLLRAAALVHDCIYLSNGWPGAYAGFRLRIQSGGYIRKQADKKFYKIMRECGVNWYRANMAYLAVRIGGRFKRNF